MHRTQISLSSDLQYRARRRAREQGISLAEYVRRLVERDTEDNKPSVDVSMIFNLGSSGEPTNVGKYKDEMVGEAIAARKLRRDR